MVIRATLLLLTGILSLLGSPTPALAADCPCGPLYCLNDPALPRVLAAKKAALRKDGYPDRLVALLDRQGQCQACITNAPDGFSIVLVFTKNQRIDVIPWDQDAERIADEQLARGELKEYLLVNSRQVCSCCEQPKYNQRDDYDEVIDVNRRAAISCTYDSAKKKATCK
jgi:hypothetical protein